MRALLVVNPKATATTPRMREVLASALASEVKLDVEVTQARGHAIELAAQARVDGLDVVVALGGDGTVNEVVNGLLDGGPSPDGPALAVVPGGNANVFARALGLPNNAVDATSVLLDRPRRGPPAPDLPRRRGRRGQLGRTTAGSPSAPGSASTPPSCAGSRASATAARRRPRGCSSGRA